MLIGMGSNDQGNQTVLQTLMGSGFMVAVWKTFERWVEWRRTTASSRALTDMAVIYDHLNELQSFTNSGRVLLIYCSNGGGLPHAGKPIYCTILYEVKNTDLPPIRTNWQNVPIDEGYVKLVSELVGKGEWHGEPHQLADGFLKDLYTKEGVKYSMVQEVARTKSRFYFVAARWYDIKDCPPIPVVENAFQVFKNKAKRLLESGK